MYIDETVLNILYKVGDNKALGKVVLDDYQQNINRISIDVAKAYLANPTIPKPKNEAIEELLKMKNQDTEKVSKSKLEYLYVKVMTSIASTPEYVYMLEKAVKRFNEIIFKTQLAELGEDEKKELDDYLANLETTYTKNAEILEKMTEKQPSSQPS